MEAPGDPAHGSDEGDDYAPSSPWLPPDDRLWRHPSEVRYNPAPVVVAKAPSPGLRAWLGVGSKLGLALTSGLCGALACAGVFWATGALHPQVIIGRKLIGAQQIRAANNPPPAPVADSVAPSVVGISVTGASGPAYGSGVAVETAGDTCYVLTDLALFSQAGSSPRVKVNTYFGTTKKATLALRDPAAGVAVVTLDWPTKLTAYLGTAARAQTGEQVYALGSPWAAAASAGSYFSTGTLTDQETYVQPSSSSPGIYSLLVANVDVDPSAAGGPLVDPNGYVIGITTPASDQLQRPDLSYVTPIDIAMADVDGLVLHGHAGPHAWMGILSASDITGPGATALGLAAGVQVDAVAPASPLARAGLRDGDIITAINGSSASSVGALIELQADAQPGEVATVNWVHQGHRRRANVTLVLEPVSMGAS